ncbi:MAG: zinc ribbon domain-containing protein [Caldimonas sp.]
MSTVPAENTALPAGMSASAFSSLFQAINGLRNTRALVALIGCTVSGVLVAGLLVAMAGTLGMLAGVLAFFVYVVAFGTGINAAGLLQMDHARGISPRSTVDALVYGLMCIPKLLVLGIALFLVELAVFLVIALALVVCKAPFLGPLLFTLVFPASIVVAGVTIFGAFLCMVLSLPAIWQGATIVRALSQTLAIARSRLVEAVLLLVFVGFLSFAVGMIVFGVLGAGFVPTLAMSGSIVGFGGMGGMGGMGGLGSVMGMAQGFGGGGAGHAVAGAIGGLVLWAIAASLVLQVYLLGLCLVYLRVTEGLDLTASEAALRQKLDEARRRTAELGDKARSAAQRDAGAGSAPTPPTGSAAAAGGFAAAAAAAAAAPMAPPHPPPATPAPYPPAAAYPEPAPYPGPVSHAPDVSHDTTDISLPFDDVVPPAPPHASTPSVPAYSAPVYVPPPAQPPAAAPVLPVATTCPQCLSPISAEDVFCGVCGYRLK